MSARSQAFSPESVVAARSGRMRDVFDFVTVIADGDSSVLISGESGTGKELSRGSSASVSRAWSSAVRCSRRR